MGDPMSGPTARQPHHARPAIRRGRAPRSGAFNSARLAVPAPPAPVVARARLFARLDASVAGPVTAVTAPAGSGKTTLLASWLDAAAPAESVAWLSVDEGDNSPARLWRYLFATLVPNGHPPALPADRHALADMAHALAERLPPTILVLDDAHCLTDPALVASVAALVREPSPVRLVWCGRSRPPHPLSRLRLSGELTDVTVDDLAFTRSEAHELARLLGAAVPDREVRALLARTEGWAVGLTLALRSRAGGTGDLEPDVADYFRDAVLASQPDHALTFLLRTSVLERLTAATADAVTGRRDGGPVIDGLVRAGVFLRAEREPDMYRFHPMFHDFLRREAAAAYGGDVADMHLRAARWYAANGESVAAARHAIAGRRSTYAAGLLAGPAAARVYGPERDAVVALIDQIPSGEGAADPHVAAAHALAALCRREDDVAAAHASRARDLLVALPADDRSDTAAVLDMVDSASARRRGELSTSDPVDARDPGLRAVALLHGALARMWAGQAASAAESLDAAAAAAREAGLDLSLTDALSHAALLHAARGQLREGGVKAREAAQIAARRGWTHSMQTACAFVAMSVVHWQRGDLDGAGVHLAVAGAACRRDPEPTTAVALELTGARIRLASGDVAGAGQALATARQVPGTTAHPLLTDWVALVAAEVDVAAGNPEAALAGLAGLLAQDGPLRGGALVAAARAHLALRRPAAARDLLRPAASVGDIGVRVDAWLLDALAADRLGHDGAVSIGVAEALTLAAPEGLMRPFLAAGADLRDVLGRHHDLMQRADGFGERVLAVLDPDAEAPRLVEPITDRESVVVRYLPTLLTTTDIARELYVSTNTVKSHLKSLYRKLGVGNRRDAVYAARRLGLL
jgi:LuxR family transcriptional regulator, maltose regulon positive regulatory protein